MEQAAWTDIYKDFLPRVFHFFCFKIGDSMMAEELTSITFEKAWASRAGYCQQKGDISGWIFGIAQHVAVDYLRRPRREIQLEIVENIGEEAALSVEDETLRQIGFHRLAKLVQRLPRREQELVALKYGAELTNREIAHLTGITESNVGTILFRTVRQLRAQWEQSDD